MLMLPAVSAQAKVFCVNTSAGCDQTDADLQTALLDARNNAGEDTVKLGDGSYARAGGFSYDFSDPVHILGTGGRSSGPTIGSALADTTANPSTETVLKVVGNTGSTISGIDVSVPGGTGAGNTGIETSGAVANVLVHPSTSGSPSNLATGVLLDAGGSLTNSDVLLTLGQSSTAVDFEGASVSVADVRLQAATGVICGTGTGAATLRWARVDFGSAGASLSSGALTIEDSLLVAHAEAGGNPTGLRSFAAAGSTSIAANHTTLIGPSAPLGTALVSSNAASGTVALTFRNGVMSGFLNRLARSAGGSGPANITTDYSDYASGTSSDTGPGSISEPNHLTAAPGFVSATDYHLRADSPLVDAGEPPGLAAGESSVDLDGQPRITDGDGDGSCTARRDIGAYEFQPGPRAPIVVASAGPPSPARTGELVAFSAFACDPDGDALTYSWSFDDGGGASGLTVLRSFSTQGPHFGTLRVTDSTGRSTTGTGSVFVELPFRGLTIAKQKVRASKRGKVAVKGSCPATTLGACGGVLQLGGGSAVFSVAAGTTKTVVVKLSKAKLKSLRKRRQLKLTATAESHDTFGNPRATGGTVTVLAPH